MGPRTDHQREYPVRLVKLTVAPLGGRVSLLTCIHRGGTAAADASHRARHDGHSRTGNQREPLLTTGETRPRGGRPRHSFGRTAVNWILLNIPLAAAITAMVVAPLVVAIRREPLENDGAPQSPSPQLPAGNRDAVSAGEDATNPRELVGAGAQ
jgi:hypothetical protein